jgi:hypothetical protein
MKRLGLVLAAAGLLAVGVTGVADAGNGGGNPRDFVAGAVKRLGYNDSVERHFILSAHATPQGPQGSYTATYGQGKTRAGYSGRVTCVNVVGNFAKVGIVITSSENRPDAVVGTYEILRVTDYGNPSDGGQRDSLSPGDFSVTPAVCDAPYGDPTPTYSGNFEVHDGDL